MEWVVKVIILIQLIFFPIFLLFISEESEENSCTHLNFECLNPVYLYKKLKYKLVVAILAALIYNIIACPVFPLVFWVNKLRRLIKNG